MSIGKVMVMPTPTAGPLIAAMIGFFDSKMRSDTSPPPSRCVSNVSARPCAVLSKVSPPVLRSAPAQKPRPAPVTITARTVVVSIGLVEGIEQLDAHPCGERVELVRAIQSDGEDAVGDLVRNRFVVHLTLPASLHRR